MTNRNNIKPVETFTAVRDMAFDTAIADHLLAQQIRKAGKTDDRTQREFKAGRIMRAMLTGEKLKTFLAAGDNERGAVRDDLAKAAYAVLDKTGYINPDKDGLKPEYVKDLRKQFKFLGEMGAYHFLWVVGEEVPPYEEWSARRGMPPHHGRS